MSSENSYPNNSISMRWWYWYQMPKAISNQEINLMQLTNTTCLCILSNIYLLCLFRSKTLLDFFLYKPSIAKLLQLIPYPYICMHILFLRASFSKWSATVKDVSINLSQRRCWTSIGKMLWSKLTLIFLAFTNDI